MTSQEQIYVVHSFCYFLSSWISFPCLYLDVNWSVSFFILFSAKDSFLFLKNLILCFIFSSTSSDQCTKVKIKSFEICYYHCIFFHYYNDLIDCCKLFGGILLCWYKRYSIFLISFFNFYDFSPAFVCTTNNGSSNASSPASGGCHSHTNIFTRLSK